MRSDGAGGAGVHPWERAGDTRRPRRQLSIASPGKCGGRAEDAKGSGLYPGLDCGLIYKPCKGMGGHKTRLRRVGGRCFQVRLH